MSPFVSRGKPIESNKDEEESDYSEVEEKFHIKLSKTDKIQSATKKESNKARINTSSVFQWNTSSLHAKTVAWRMKTNGKKRQNSERLLTVPMHQK